MKKISIIPEEELEIHEMFFQVIRENIDKHKELLNQFSMLSYAKVKKKK